MITENALAVALAVLLLPVAAPGQVPEAPSSRSAAAPLAATAKSDQEKLRLLEERHAALEHDYARRAAELAESRDRLAESMARLGEVRDGQEEKKKLLAENKTLRDLAAAEARRRSSAEASLRQIESDHRELRAQYEKRGESLAVAAQNLAACDDEKAVLRQDVDRRTTAAGSLATTVSALEKELAELAAVCRQPARLKEELERAKGQVREHQSAVEALQRQLSLVENELNTMRGQSWQ